MKREEVLVLLAFLLFVQGYLLENVFSALLAFSIIVYLAYLRSEFEPEIEAERRIDRNLVEGVRAKSRLKIRNLTNKKLKVKVIEDFLPPGFKAEMPPPLVLNEGEEKEVEYFIIPAKGVYRIQGPRIRLIDLRELYYSDYVASEVDVEVYPSLERIREEVRAEESLKLRNQSLLGLQTAEVHSLRKFQPGDDLKHIEWKATARLGDLIVKDFLKEAGERCIHNSRCRQGDEEGDWKFQDRLCNNLNTPTCICSEKIQDRVDSLRRLRR